VDVDEAFDMFKQQGAAVVAGADTRPLLSLTSAVADKKCTLNTLSYSLIPPDTS
jgi:hypothetical protein